MRRSVLVAVMVGVMMAAGTAGRAAAMPGIQAAPAKATPTDAAPFMGDWTLSGSGQNGPATFNLSVKADGDKVVATIGSEQQPETTVTDISKADKSLILRYQFDYNGMAIGTVVTLTPADEGKVNGTFDFADGAYVMETVGTKKAGK